MKKSRRASGGAFLGLAALAGGLLGIGGCGPGASTKPTQAPGPVASAKPTPAPADGRPSALSLVRRYEDQSYHCATWLPDGTLALVGSLGLTTMDADGRPSSVAGASERIRASSTGQHFVTGGSKLSVWSRAERRIVAEVPDLGYWPSVELSDTWLVWSGYEDWLLHRYRFDGATLSELEPIDLGAPCVTGNFSRMARSSDGSRLAVTYGPGFEITDCSDMTRAPAAGAAASAFRPRIFEPSTWSLVAERGVAAEQPPSLAFDAKGSLLALGTKSGVEVWSVETKRVVREYAVDAELAELSFVPGKPWIAIGLQSGNLALYDFDKGELVVDENAHAGPIQCLAATQTRLVTTGKEGTAAVWSL